MVTFCFGRKLLAIIFVYCFRTWSYFYLSDIKGRAEFYIKNSIGQIIAMSGVWFQRTTAELSISAYYQHASWDRVVEFSWKLKKVKFQFKNVPKFSTLQKANIAMSALSEKVGDGKNSKKTYHRSFCRESSRMSNVPRKVYNEK